METNIAIAFVIALIVLGVASVVKDLATKKEVKKANDDLNIEFGATEGTGIHQVKKEYPGIVLKDDFRETVEEVKEIKYFHERKRNE